MNVNDFIKIEYNIFELSFGSTVWHNIKRKAIAAIRISNIISIKDVNVDEYDQVSYIPLKYTEIEVLAGPDKTEFLYTDDSVESILETISAKENEIQNQMSNL